MDEASGGDGKAGVGGGIEDDMEVGDCSEDEEEDDDEELTPSPCGDQPPIIPSPVGGYEGLASPLRVGSVNTGLGGHMAGGMVVQPPVPIPAGPIGPPPAGKPSNLRRGPGRPRTRGAHHPPAHPRMKKPIGLKLKRWKGLLVSGVVNSSGKPVDGAGAEGEEGEQGDTQLQQTPPPQEPVRTPIFVDEPLFSEQWPGKLCALCNLSEYSQLGQGEMLRVECPLISEWRDTSPAAEPPTPEHVVAANAAAAKLFPNRRQKGGAKARQGSTSGQEPVDELSLVGHTDIPDPNSLVDMGYVFVHEWCAGWCTGVVRSEDRTFGNLAAGLAAALSRRCYYCTRYGAGAPCVIPSCNKFFHTPCAAAAGAFQHPKTRMLVCSQHIDHVPSMVGELCDVACQVCDTLGNVSNIVMCSMCGSHHHGFCIGNALHAGLRAGWQCPQCRVCQLCRGDQAISGADVNARTLVCDHCDKAYHLNCMRPAMSSVPKVGWKCKRCRLCSDCGARTPGGGLSSRWHSNYTVCDSCYQQRNKGFSCPICHKAYRAAALREMVRCSQCQRFVHGTCDGEADFVSYHRKKEAHPEYQYICIACKNNTTDKLLVLKRKDSTEEPILDTSLHTSQESLPTGDEMDFEPEKVEESPGRLTYGLGKGKPFYASKIAKKKLGLGNGPGRPKGSGKISTLVPIPMSSFQKRSRFAEFGKRRGVKPKVRGMFGFPGLGLQRPQSESSGKSDEPSEENKLVLCSSKDKFVLGQDMCVMCGSLGIDQEACLIACAQCGQCYHPYCVQVKEINKVMLTRGWRCLDCTVCEGCGQKNDEARLILCEDCDISYHIYCMDPPLGCVPTGIWKCKWCAQCQTCGATSPGTNSNWQSDYKECGPCSSRNTCPACLELYTDGDLIIKCLNCDRWLHCICDTISTEQEAEAVCAIGYTCTLCRPANQALLIPPTPIRPPTPELTIPVLSVDIKPTPADYYVDGVCLSEVGLQHIKSLSTEHSQQQHRRKRPGFKNKASQDNDILATIESVVSGDGENEGSNAVFKDGMVWGTKDNGCQSPPEGFTLFTMDSGVIILKRKKQRNLQKLGIGGFSAVKLRTRFKDDDDGAGVWDDKPRRKPRCNKKRSKLAENYPSYLLEAFFGRDLMDTSKDTTQDLESSSDESDDAKTKDTAKPDSTKAKSSESKSPNRMLIKEEDGSDSETLKDILHLPDNLLQDNDLVNTIMTGADSHIKPEEILQDSSMPDNQSLSESNSNQKDELSDILGPNFSLETMVRETGLPAMDSKDVEEIFKGVLTDESQESVNSSFPGPTPPPPPQTPTHAPQVSPQPPSSNSLRSGPVLSNLSSPGTFPSASPSEYSNSPQFSPDSSPWNDENSGTYNQRSAQKMESDEALGQYATISSVLYANANHPEWKTEFPVWTDRCKQILKKWRQLPIEKKAPYVQQARENRVGRVKKTQQEIEKPTMTKSSRELEQERQWKHLQASVRQQQILAQSRTQMVRKQEFVETNQGIVTTTQTQATQQMQATSTQQQDVQVVVRTPTFVRSVRPPVSNAMSGVTTFAARPSLQPPPPPMPGEMNHRQLRDLLQRGDTSSNTMKAEVPEQPVPTPTTVLRPRLTAQIDARVRLLLQHQRTATVFQPGIRLAAAAATAAQRSQLEQFSNAEHKHQQHQQQQLARSGVAKDGEELPYSVTAELEKLEQEGGIAEADAVSAILGDLAEDDDELLAEMGTDFNILEYADPELDNVTGGEKTNILDDLEDEVDKKKNNERPGNKPEVKKDDQPSKIQGVQESPTTTTPATPPVAALPSEPSFARQFAAPNIPSRPPVSVASAPTSVGTVRAGIMQAPPPPYPGPPPPYPGAVGAPRVLGPPKPRPVLPSRSLLLEEQPLLLEDLLIEEKREQEKQGVGNTVSSAGNTSSTGSALMSDADFEMLRADVLGTSQQASSQIQGQTFLANRAPLAPPAMVRPPEPRVVLFNAPVLAAPPLPPDNIVTEQDRQAQLLYEQWLNNNNKIFTEQLKYYETEIQKLRKARKSLNSKQRQQRKNGNELSQTDAMELQRVTGEQAVLQKHLEAARKQCRQHTTLMQEYQTKYDKSGESQQQQVNQQMGDMGTTPPQSPMITSPVTLYTAPSPVPTPPSASPHPHQSPTMHHNPDDKQDQGMVSPRPPSAHHTPPSPQQFQLRHSNMVPRFARSPEGAVRPRLPMGVAGTTTYVNTSNGPQRSFIQTSPGNQIVIQQSALQNQGPLRLQMLQGLTHQQQQQLLNLRQQQIQQQKLLEMSAERAANNPGIRAVRPQLGKVNPQFRQSPQQYPQSSPIQSPIGSFPAGSPSPIQPNSPVPFQPSGSPMHSPIVVQFQSGTPQHSPRVYHPSSSPYPNIQPNSPLPQFSQPISPMPPQSPRVNQYQPPSSPCPPSNSPMGMRRPSSSLGGSPASDRPHSTEGPWAIQDDSSGSGHNPGGGGGGSMGLPVPPDFNFVKLGLKGGSPRGTHCRHPGIPPGFTYVKLGLRGGAPMWSGNAKPQEGEAKDDTPPAKPALIKKGDPKARQSEDTDSEMTVYDDIVLVGKETNNLEVQELKSALQGNVMSTVVSMPMVIEPGHIQMMEVSSDLLVDDLVVLDVDNGSTENDLIVDKDVDSMIILDEELDKDAELDLDEEESPSPPPRKRMTGKVLPGQSISKDEEKPDSDSEDTTFLSPHLIEPIKPSFNSSDKSDGSGRSVLKEKMVSKPEGETKVQPNVVIRTPVTFTPVITQKCIPVCNERQLSIQQATVASLVDNAVKAAQQMQLHKNNTVIHPGGNAESHTSETVSLPKMSPLNQVISKNKSMVVDFQKISEEFKERNIVTSQEQEMKAQNDVGQQSKINFSKYSIPKPEDFNLKYELAKNTILSNIAKDGSVIKRKVDMESFVAKSFNSGSSENIKTADKGEGSSEEKKESKEKLPCIPISSSILEAQLKSIFRSQEHSLPLVSMRKPPDYEEETDTPDTSVEGLAARFQRHEERKAELKNKTKTLYTQVKNDTRVLGGTSYKIFQGGSQTTSDIVNFDEDKRLPDLFKTYKKIEEAPGSHESWKTETGLLAQRVLASQSSDGSKETHYVSFNTAKDLQDEKKFLSLSTMIVQKKEEAAAAAAKGQQRDDSQNVLLKKLLQNTACASSGGSTTPCQQTQPVLSLEAQLARPVPPTPSALLPPILAEPPSHTTTTHQWPYHTSDF